MFQQHFSGLPLWQFHNLGRFDNLAHFVSGREGGVSPGKVGSLNLSFKVADERSNVEQNRERLARAMQIAPERLRFPSQTHSANVKNIDQLTSEKDIEDIDALITNSKGICIAVMSADCVPVLLFDPTKEAAAAIHAGWRGTVARIVQKTVRAMIESFGTNPADLVAGIGPSICPDVYEVGEEVIEEVESVFGTNNNLISKKTTAGKGFLNLWEANRIQLLDLGVKDNSIEVAEICTFINSESFFSARKSKNKAGRFAAGILLK